MMKFYAFLFLTFIGLSTSAQQQSCSLPTEPSSFDLTALSLGPNNSNRLWDASNAWNTTFTYCNPATTTHFLIGDASTNHIRTYNCASQNLNLPSGSKISIFQGSTLQFDNDPAPSTERNITINSGAWVTVAGTINGVDPGDDPTITVKSGGVLYVTCTGRIFLGQLGVGAGSLIVEPGGKVFIECGGKITIRSLGPTPPDNGELTINGAICQAPSQGRYAAATPLVLQTTACTACSGSNKAEIDVDANTAVTGSGSVGNDIIATGWNKGAFSFPLPVKLTSFTATTSNGVVNVKWETAQESNNKEFELQRSANGKDWSTIVTVAGKGTTELKSNYAHTDRAPLRGVSLYRLKQIDYDGKNEISQVVAVKIGENGRFAFDVTPNLVVNNFKVVASEDLRSSEISIFNTVGNRMNAVVNRNGNEANVDVSNLPSGQYIIRIQNGTEALTKRFVVNK
jgi:hypothetical protein